MDLYTVLFSTGLITATYFLLNPNNNLFYYINND